MDNVLGESQDPSSPDTLTELLAEASQEPDGMSLPPDPSPGSTVTGCSFFNGFCCCCVPGACQCCNVFPACCFSGCFVGQAVMDSMAGPSKRPPTDVTIRVTGHSLGGAMHGCNSRPPNRCCRAHTASLSALGLAHTPAREAAA